MSVPFFRVASQNGDFEGEGGPSESCLLQAPHFCGVGRVSARFDGGFRLVVGPDA